MRAYDYIEKAKHEQEKQRSLEAIDSRLARHERLTWITLMLVVILSGLSLALLATQFITYSN